MVLTEDHPSQDQDLFPETQSLTDPEHNLSAMDQGEMKIVIGSQSDPRTPQPPQTFP